MLSAPAPAISNQPTRSGSTQTNGMIPEVPSVQTSAVYKVVVRVSSMAPNLRAAI